MSAQIVLAQLYVCVYHIWFLACSCYLIVSNSVKIDKSYNCSNNDDDDDDDELKLINLMAYSSLYVTIFLFIAMRLALATSRLLVYS